MGKVGTPEHQHPHAYDHQHHPAHGLEVVKTKIQTKTDYIKNEILHCYLRTFTQTNHV